MLRIRKARIRIALAGAVASMLFLTLLAFATRFMIRKVTFDDVDNDLRTLAVALASDFELQGLEELQRDRLEFGLAANLFEFRLEDHSAILFRGEHPFAVSGDLIRSRLLPGTGRAFAKIRETPYTAVEPFSGQRRTCRFLVTHLTGRASGSTLVLFRSIDSKLRTLENIDRLLALFVLTGFIGTALILALAVRNALRPVEEVTRVAADVQASDLSGRVAVHPAGEEFERLVNVINSLFERLDNAFRSQKRLVSDAAHELKTPVAVLLGEAQEALRADVSPEQREMSLRTIEQTCRGLAREIELLLQLARGDAADPALRQEVELGDLAGEIVENVEPFAAERGVRCAATRLGSARAIADRAGMTRLISNLVTNAVLYTDTGTEIEVRTGSSDGSAFVEVRDRGPGIPDQERARIFGRFVRLEPARLRNPEGSGLGLAIVEQVASAHSGSIEIEGREGGGSVFRVRIPAEIQTSDEQMSR